MCTKRILKGRRAALATATVAALSAGGAAYAAIPDASTGRISSCYNNASGAVRVVDDSSGGYSPVCPSGETALTWNQQGPRGYTGPRGPQGPPGPGNMHWLKYDANGSLVASSDAGVSSYTGAAYAYFSIPNVDPSKCAITIQPVDAMFKDPITTSYVLYGNYVYARAQQTHNGQLDWYPKVALDIVRNCGQVW